MLQDSLNLASCSAAELSSWLVANRFHNDQTETTTFLLEAMSSLPDAEQISEQLVADASAVAETKTNMMDVAASLLEEPIVVSSTTPRCKFQLTLTDSGMVFEEATRTSNSPSDTYNNQQQKQRIVITSVDYMIAFPKPRDCQPQKKVPSDMLLLVLAENSSLLYKQKPIKQLCFQLPEGLPTLKKGDDDDDDVSLEGLDATDQWMRVCSQSLGGIDPRSMIRVVNPATQSKDDSATDTQFWRFQFRSYQDENVSTTTGDLPFVPCNMGVKDGSLYPLQEGLLFFAPPLFLPRSRLQSIECGRSGNSASRYIDLKVATDDGEHIEFNNIHRTEMTGLNHYIHQTLIPAMRKDADGAVAARDDEDVASNVEAELVTDVDGNAMDMLDASMETHPPTARKMGRPKRKALLEATRINKSVLARGADQFGKDDKEEEDESDDGDYTGNQGRPTKDLSSDEHSGDGSDDSDEGTNDDETESEDEDEMAVPVKKSRKS
ncbi:hypothetical protein MPSEU_000084100 [Mayamaea pseudoterrestris]|nr:hypothetical protein MPSEU_000084100 [Mayamaea pseudoterrestris]